MPEFAHAEDLMIEPDGRRVPAEAVQAAAAAELVSLARLARRDAEREVS